MKYKDIEVKDLMPCEWAENDKKNSFLGRKTEKIKLKDYDWYSTVFVLSLF